MGPEIQVIDADITTLDVMAIVNAANAELAPGRRRLRSDPRRRGTGTGEGMRHPGRLSHRGGAYHQGLQLARRMGDPCRRPGVGGGENREDSLLRNCYLSCLDLAHQHKLTSIAFPAISTGIYGFPAPRAADIAVRAAVDDTRNQEKSASSNTLERIIFCCFGEDSTNLHKASLQALSGRN